jgi:hypothetical protein
VTLDQKALTRFGQRPLARGALHEPSADVFFQLRELSAHRRLLSAQLARGAREAAGAPEDREDEERVQVEV